MKSAPYTIRIFVPEGDPEGIRVIDRMNWTGMGVIFPRNKWEVAKNRAEVCQSGIYILVGYQNEEDDLPTLYIGQSDTLKDRLDEHYKKKDFWDYCIIFVSTNNGLNRAHITWLEYALVEKALLANRSKLDNSQYPKEPNLTESEKADTKAFLVEVLQILPLVGLRAFEKPKAISTKGDESLTDLVLDDDTVIVPAKKDGFERVFIGENCWYAIRISGGKLHKIKYIAAYQSAPISAITHYAPVKFIEPYGESGKFKVVFSEKALELSTPIPFADAASGSLQGPRYTNLKKLLDVGKVSELFV